ncbi:MAG: peptidase S8 [Candidatus Sericytochromatia bacterium]|nr:peptidase S8 [Candidatus Sericytochromatia bacterium]
MAFSLTTALLGACGLSTTPTSPRLSPASPEPVQQASVRQATHLVVKRKTGSGADSTRLAFEQKYRVTLVIPHVLDAIGVDVVPVPATMDAADLLARMSADEGIEYARLPGKVSLPRLVRNGTDLSVKSGKGTSDPLRNLQYGLTKVDAEAAWKITPGNGQVAIAIIDTGVDFNHPDLKGKLLTGFSTIAAQPSGKDDHGHGTHCAGIAAAVTDNAVGVAGMAPKAMLMPVKVLDASGNGADDDVATGIVWAADNGADVISLSLGTDQADPLMKDAVAYAQARRNCVIVAAMGNDGASVASYPAKFAGVIAVGATDAQDRLASYSNFGSWMSVVAPGTGIVSTFPTYAVTLNQSGYSKDYASLDGTSMAAPFVAGLAALVKSQGTRQTPAQVKAAITKGADDLGVKGFDDRFGFGRINARKTLSSLK